MHFDSSEVTLTKLYEELTALRNKNCIRSSRAFEVYRKVQAITEEQLDTMKNIGDVGQLIVTDLTETIGGESHANHLTFGNRSSVSHLIKLKDNVMKFLTNYDKDVTSLAADELNLNAYTHDINFYTERLFEIRSLLKIQKEVTQKFIKIMNKNGSGNGSNITGIESLEDNSASRAFSSLSDFSSYENIIASSPKAGDNLLLK